MMGSMMQNMDQMTGLMKKMTGMMGQSVDEAKMRKMSETYLNSRTSLVF
jgi:hypothetical protein